MKKVVFWVITTILSMIGIYWADYKIGEFLGTKLADAIIEMGGDE